MINIVIKRYRYAENLRTIIITVALVLFFRSYVVQAYEIPTPSMSPTVQTGERLLVNQLEYRFADPRRGDIIVFENPLNKRDVPFLKRIVGLPGESLQIKERRLFIDGVEISERYAAHTVPARFAPVYPRDDLGPVLIPEGKYFVMGDNREDSFDSRWWGFVDKSEIIGKAVAVYWSRENSETFPNGIRWSRFATLL